ncbi:MAG: hypothetical protein E7509_07710 [Ruminococcus sp.]|nr:hypothetical protein [Ruminococcus sp.]
MRFENTQVWGFEHAVRGMRNPMNSWAKSDSKYENGEFVFGENDLDLAKRLIAGGTEHRKFLRQVMISVDITAPLYWWKEFDTYKVGTTANSTSTMHKLATTPITLDCFEIDDYCGDVEEVSQFVTDMIAKLEDLRVKFNETKDKRIWKELIRWLPESWLQTRTVTLNYENAINMFKQRKNHKLSEWSQSFIDWIKALPYAEEFIIN